MERDNSTPSTPIIAPGPEIPKGPWQWVTARVLLPAGLALLIVALTVIHFVGTLFTGHKETPQEAAQRKAAAQYQAQTTPANPADVAGFTTQTGEAARTIGATAANLGNAINQGLNGQAPGVNAANPLAVPGDPSNTNPVVYKAWADANAATGQFQNAPGTSAPGGAPGTPTGAAGSTETLAASAAEERREMAKKREQQRLAASSMAIDFTRQVSDEKEKKAGPEQAPETSPENTDQPAIASASTPVVPVPTAPRDEKTEPISVKLHNCIELCEGDLIETVLTNRIDGAQAGFADVMVTQPVYSHDWDPKGRRLLIPVGSRVLGNVTAVNSNQAQRLFVAFHKVRRPDGTTFSLDNFTGLDMAGAAGLRDLVNHHYAAIFGASLAIAAIGGVTQIGNNSNSFAYDPSVSIRNGISQQMGQESMQILNHFLNQPPSMVVREGRNLVKVYLSQDLSLPAYTPKETYAKR